MGIDEVGIDKVGIDKVGITRQTPPKKPTSQVNGAMQNSAPGQVLPHFQPRKQPFLPS